MLGFCFHDPSFTVLSAASAAICAGVSERGELGLPENSVETA
jgi:hypothetical protein